MFITPFIWFTWSYLKPHSSCRCFLHSCFIRPLEKRPYYAVAMSVRPSTRPHVCLAVHPPAFSGLFQHAWIYHFKTWYMHSVGGTTCRVWVSSQLGHVGSVLQTKVSQTIFCNRGFINQDKSFKFATLVACCILPDTCSIFSKISFSELWRLFLRVLRTTRRWHHRSSSSFIPIGWF